MADLAAGATLLGSGGGGDAQNAAAIVRCVLERLGPVRLLKPEDLDPVAWLASVGAIGATTVMLERLPGETEFTRAVRALERHLGIEVTALQGVEAAGVNALLPVAAAAWLGLPLVDADGTGRAFPRIDQTVFTLAGLPIVPLALAEPSGAELLITGVDGADAERLARAVLPALGGWAAGAQYVMRAADSRRHALSGTFSRAIRLGRILRRGQDDPHARDRLPAGIGIRRLFTGTVLEVRQRGRGGALSGTVTMKHTDDPQRTLRLEMADEYLLAIDDGSVTAHVPEIIAVLHARTWHPISAERIASGQHVDVLSLPAPPPLLTPAALRLVGPGAFGLDLPVTQDRS
ncbi:DUF917 domain-containing protein [Actinoallomurus acanthiterrae]